MERIPGLDEWLTRGPDETEHHPDCPLHEDFLCNDCDIEENSCSHDECICADLEDEAKSDKADAKADELREMKYNP